MIRTRKVVVIGLLVGLGLIMHFIETMLPLTAIVPGAKLGLANIVSLIGIVLFGFSGGLQIVLLRIIIGSLLAGTFMTINFYLSFSGGLFSFFVMYMVYEFLREKFSLIGVSVIGAVAHNIGQIVIAYIVIENSAIFYYLPFLTLLAVPTGISVGLVSFFTVSYLPTSLTGR